MELQSSLPIQISFDPSKYKRNENGLLPNVPYIFNEDGMINWRKMVKPEYLAVRKECEKEVLEKYGKKSLEEIDKTQVEDKYLLILLPGIKALSKLRGFLAVNQHVDDVKDTKATVTCSIDFIGNYETEGHVVTFSDVGSASIENTKDFGQKYLESIAANRAFVRAVRNFLGINIVGQDEVETVSSPTAADEPPQLGSVNSRALLQKATEAGKTFAQIKEGCTNLYHAEIAAKKKPTYNSDPSTWNRFEDIPGADAFTVIGQLVQSIQKNKK